MLKPILGLQLYSLRREFDADAEGTLRLIPGLGYEAIETAGTYNWTAARWKQLLAETGLKVVGAHIGDLTDLAKQVEFQQALGNHRYILPYVPESNQSADGFRRVAATLNKAAQELRAYDGEVFYHNHDFEFKDLGGGLNGYDILLQETDPKLIRFEVDTYWVERAGRDAAQFVAAHADRIGIIHAKELRRSDQSDQAAGKGDIDFPSIISLAKQNNWPVIVEFEGEGAVASSRESAAYLKSLL
jgi:sugar phosphate isomerase/epimerase